MLLVCTEAAERTKAAALDFHSKAAFSGKTGDWCRFRQTCREADLGDEIHACILSDFSKRTIA